MAFALLSLALQPGLMPRLEFDEEGVGIIRPNRDMVKEARVPIGASSRVAVHALEVSADPTLLDLCVPERTPLALGRADAWLPAPGRGAYPPPFPPAHPSPMLDRPTHVLA